MNDELPSTSYPNTCIKTLGIKLALLLVILTQEGSNYRGFQQAVLQQELGFLI